MRMRSCAYTCNRHRVVGRPVAKFVCNLLDYSSSSDEAVDRGERGLRRKDNLCEIKLSYWTEARTAASIGCGRM